MITELNTQLRIAWVLAMPNGSIFYDDTPKPGDVSKWRQVQELLSETPKSISLVLLDNDKKVVKDITAGETSKFFFFSKRVSYVLGDIGSKQEYGIGYHDWQTNSIRITWYDENLDPVQLEIRDFEKCQSVLIPKISTASSFQN